MDDTYRKGKASIYLKNVFVNWIGYGARLIVSFFLVPFVVHTLGNTVYGVWSLLISLTGYMGLLELGVMTSTARHINFYIARDDDQNLSRVVCTSLGFYVAVSVLLCGAAFVLSLSLNKIFRNIPAVLLNEARPILFILCINIFFGFMSAIFRQLLAAKERFDLINVITLAVLTISTIGTVIVLKTGHGITSLAVVQTAASAVASILLLVFSLKWGPIFSFGLRYFSQSTFKELFQFGVFAFIADMGTQLVFYTDSLVIGMFLGAAAITMYSISMMLIENGRSLIKQVRDVLAPDLLKSGGLDSLDLAKSLLINSTRFIMFFAIPLLVGFIALGKEFISLWMGNEYVQSYPVLVILSISQFGSLSARASGVILMGLNRIRILAAVSILEGVANLILSIAFIKMLSLGIVGVALGTLVPMLVMSSLALPILACSETGLSLRTFVKGTFFRWGVTALLLLGFSYLVVNRIPVATSWPTFAFKAGIVIAAYMPISFAILLSKSEKGSFLKALKSLANSRAKTTGPII